MVTELFERGEHCWSYSSDYCVMPGKKGDFSFPPTHGAGAVQAQHYDFHGHGADGREGVDETGFVLFLLLVGHVGLR